MRLNEKGVSMVEVLVTVAILGLLASLVIPSYQETVRRSREKQAMAHLAGYYRGAKVIIAEFGYNPGNFHAVGFKAEGDLYHRIAAADSGDRLPDVYPDDHCCFSTELVPPSSPSPPCPSHTMSHDWTEMETNFLSGASIPTPTVSGKEFKTFAYPSANRSADEVMCIDEAGEVQWGDCS